MEMAAKTDIGPIRDLVEATFGDKNRVRTPPPPNKK